MSPYIVKEGQQVDDGTRVYRPGGFVPGEKGSLADMESVGAVEWRDAPAPPHAAKAAKPAAAPKRKAVK